MSSFDTIQRELFDGANYSPLPTINKPSSPKKFKRTVSENARKAQRVSRVIKQIGEGAGIKQRAIEDHLEILRNLGCEYLVVTDFDRTYVHGTKAQPAAPAQPAKPKTQRSSPGTFSTHYKPLMDPMKVGDVAIIPFKNDLGVSLDPTRLNSAVSAYAAKYWGAGASSTFINRKTKCVEVLRKK